jgi:hypothetical protein
MRRIYSSVLLASSQREIDAAGTRRTHDSIHSSLCGVVGRPVASRRTTGPFGSGRWANAGALRSGYPGVVASSYCQGVRRLTQSLVFHSNLVSIAS